MKKPSNLIGPKVRALRNQAGLSQAALAAKCQRLGWDVSREMINHIERQERVVRDYEVVALGKILGCSSQALLSSEREALRRLS